MAAAIRQEKYDVFVSFKSGEDMTRIFISNLDAALLEKKIKANIDYRFQRGEKFVPAQVEKSTISVVIFSNDYAGCPQCLDELAHILECKERYGLIVVPIFYGIDQSDVGKQQGNYGDAFVDLEQYFKERLDKVLNWRNALTKAANISGGFDCSNRNWRESMLVERVVQHICTKLNRE